MTVTDHYIRRYLFRGVSAAPLVVFRIIFGLLMLFGACRFLLNNWVEELYMLPRFHFTYYGFDWVKVLPGNWMYLPFVLMIVSSIGIIAGLFYRVSASVFFLAFTYIELLDKTYYLNHYYFVSIVAFLMILVPANADFSVDAKMKGCQKTEIPAWSVYIFCFQLAVVYFYAGISKINHDWLLEARPLRTWLQVYRDAPLIGPLMAQKWLAYVFSWCGCVFDICVPFLLINRRTRLLAWIMLAVFHLMTGLLFPIGVFPIVMTFSTLIFFSESFHKRIVDKLKKLLRWKPQPATIHTIRQYRATMTFLSLFVLSQLLLPFRYLLYPGNLFWTEEGFRFSWRVMLMDKDGSATFFIHDKISGGTIEIRNSDYLTAFQEKEMAMQPDMILQYGQFLGHEFADTIIEAGTERRHLQHPAVTVDAYVSLNGRMHQRYIDSSVDLTKLSYNLKHRRWVLPFNE